MHNIHADSVNTALAEGIHHLLVSGVRETSRNGTVIVAPTPVVTTYYNPTRRVLYSPLRDANPFFHFFESLWMLNGDNDVAFPAAFAKQMLAYSDDSKTMWGAYGWRWRKFFKYDQLASIVRELRTNPNSRRAVLAMWNAMPVSREVETGIGMMEEFIHDDLSVAESGGKDVPCNTHAYFDLRGGKLNITVCCRSNDIIWGAYGANAVHFSTLLEYMAAWLAVPGGVYRQFSNNYHAYTDVYDEDKLLKIAHQSSDVDNAVYNGLKSYPLVNAPIEHWNADLNALMKEARKSFYTFPKFRDSFFTNVAEPLLLAHRAYYNFRKGVVSDLSGAFHALEQCQAKDWRVACSQWIVRRLTKMRKEKDRA